MSIIKQKLLKIKKDGIVDDLLPIMAFILIVVITLSVFIETNAAINSKAEINSVARKYTLLLETQGHLTSADQKSLVADLNELGFRADENGTMLTTSYVHGNDSFSKNSNTAQLSFSGDSNNSVGYGQPVALQLKVYTNVKMLSDANIFSPKVTGSYTPIVVKYHSTSKE